MIYYNNSLYQSNLLRILTQNDYNTLNTNISQAKLGIGFGSYTGNGSRTLKINVGIQYKLFVICGDKSDNITLVYYIISTSYNTGEDITIYSIDGKNYNYYSINSISPILSLYFVDSSTPMAGGFINAPNHTYYYYYIT